ncbi:hypothetical protein X971_0533 [Agrobacterium tumefaciens LBA4213 (Ach5)]|nr:hypothetical protein X971_0533 [Agrobacterium tumefaciens LBA4213 (Ach5)]
MIRPETIEETGRVARMTVVPPNGFDRRQRNMSRPFGLFCRGRA